MTDPKATLAGLNQNLNILQEREAKYAGNAPPDLLNQIEDHQKAIVLTEQTIAGDISKTEWKQALRPLLVSLETPVVILPEQPRIPFQRPLRPVHFTDRKPELAQLLLDLQPG